MLTVAQAARLSGCTENAIRYQLQIGNLTRFENAAGKIRVSRNEVLDKLLKFEEK
nr:MAG TPA: Pyocin activator protein PrtN [Caudoviricetes sp.]